MRGGALRPHIVYPILILGWMSIQSGNMVASLTVGFFYGVTDLVHPLSELPIVFVLVLVKPFSSFW